MIELIGESGTSEYLAAEDIRHALVSTWPGVDTSPASIDHVRIAASAKLSGYKVSDIDIVIVGVFKKPRKFIPRKLIKDKNGVAVQRKAVTVRNIVLAVEVKDHDSSYVRVSGDNVSVKYSRGGKTGWKSATDQNIKQVHSLYHYFKDLGQDVFVHRLLVMRGVEKIRVHGALPSSFDGHDFFSSISSVSGVARSQDGYTLGSGADQDVTWLLGAPIFQIMKPSLLDRKRMDMLVASTPESDHLHGMLGTKMVRLRGHGGAGKTVMLLQAAWKAFNSRDTRTLVLTYNHALAADIRRLLSLLKVPSSPERGGIAIITVMSFMYSWFNRLGLLIESESFEDYEERCLEALHFVEQGAITTEDISKIKDQEPDEFDFDCIFVDEGQDWPQLEADFLKKLYPTRSIVVADGIDQMIRDNHTDWDKMVAQDEREIISLDKCLRMKRNLAVFANQVARVNKVNWELNPSQDAPGGRVFLLKGSYSNFPGLHESLVKEANEKGNEKIDFLFCVPPSDVVRNAQGAQSKLGQVLRGNGEKTWEGVDEHERKDFPRLLGQFRIVQYESCRGLEGWTVVLHKAEEFWALSRESRKSQGLSENEQEAFVDLEEIATWEATLKMLIALTRPIDTLVIDMENEALEFNQSLLRIAKKYPDIVTVLK